MPGKRPPKRPPKKSDPLIVRMPHEDKQAFLKACRDEGRTASGVVRELIDGWLKRADARARLRGSLPPRRSLLVAMKTPYAQGGAIAAGLGALAVVAFGLTPSAAQGAYRADFEELDAQGDGDGVLEVEEFRISLGPWRSDPDPPAIDPALGFREKVALEQAHEFARFDRDGDGQLTADEFEAGMLSYLQNTFAAFDADGDGRLSLEEVDTRLGEPGPMFYLPGLIVLGGGYPENLDVDGDGLSVEEVLAYADEARRRKAEPPPEQPGTYREEFERFDRDGDGALVFDEFSVPSEIDADVAALELTLREIAPIMKRRTFARFDRDGDAKVTADEYEAAQLARLHETFAAFDANGDGRLTGDEAGPGPGEPHPKFYLPGPRIPAAYPGYLDCDGDGLSVEELLRPHEVKVVDGALTGCL